MVSNKDTTPGNQALLSRKSSQFCSLQKAFKTNNNEKMKVPNHSTSSKRVGSVGSSYSVHKKRRNVRFGRNSCRLYLQDMTRDEAGKVWYSADEYMKIRSDVYDDLRKASSMYAMKSRICDKQEVKELNFRGLEHHMSGRGTNVKRERRKLYVHHFLYTHKHLRVTNPIELRDLAVALSGHDKMRAERLADYDALEAYKVHNEGSIHGFSTQTMTDEEEYAEFDVPKDSNLKSRGPRSVAALLA